MYLGFLVSDKKIFTSFPYISPYKYICPRAGPFWPQGYYLNNLSISLLDEVVCLYQKSGLSGFRHEHFERFSLYQSV